MAKWWRSISHGLCWVVVVPYRVHICVHSRQVIIGVLPEVGGLWLLHEWADVGSALCPLPILIADWSVARWGGTLRFVNLRFSVCTRVNFMACVVATHTERGDKLHITMVGLEVSEQCMHI